MRVLNLRHIFEFESDFYNKINETKWRRHISQILRREYNFWQF